MKKLLVARMMILCRTLCSAQTPLPEFGFENIAPRRSEFITYSTRNLAEKGDRSGEAFYIDLADHLAARKSADADAQRSDYDLNLPLLWRDRDVFLHVGGYSECVVEVNGERVGSKRDSRTPAEFFISKYLKDGVNRISLTTSRRTPEPEEMVAPPTTEPSIFVYSQPQVRLHDVEIDFRPDEQSRHGVLHIKAILSSSRNYPEQITVGYDIYSPDKELKYYDLYEATVEGNSSDTVEFATNIYGAMNYLWSAETPRLYEVTFYLKRNRIVTEYLALKVGFGTTSFDAEHIYRNGKAINIAAVGYNSAADRKTTVEDLKHLKAKRFNTIYVSYPQPYWFYDACDEIGLYVVDRANINTDRKGDNRRVGGTLANNPQWLDEFLEREKAMYFRSRRHPSIIAWSLGGASGGGYNMYKAYEWFKSVEAQRPIVYTDGDWNNDVKLP